MDPDPNVLNWNSLVSALIGGGFALAGAFLAAWRERIARPTEEKARFQRDTLIALQDAIEAHVRAIQQLQFWRDRPVNRENIRRTVLEELYMTPEGDKLMPPPSPMDRVNHESRVRPSRKHGMRRGTRCSASRRGSTTKRCATTLTPLSPRRETRFTTQLWDE